MFSIIIPTWNNLPYLKLCVESIRKNSSYQHQVILHINEGKDGSLEWAKANNVELTYSETNIGICKAVNGCSKLAKFDYIVFMNDDMYVLPQWDKELHAEIVKLDTDCFMLSGTMIEPYNTKNKCVIVADYGRDTQSFDEEKLLKEFRSLEKNDWSGATWPPCLVHKKWWDAVGGYSEEFSPGMSSDNDFAMKMWVAGCRIFKGVEKSRVYHFVSKSTGRIEKNDGRKQFIQKWKMKQSTFHNYYLKRGDGYRGEVKAPDGNVLFEIKKLIDKFF